MRTIAWQVLLESNAPIVVGCAQVCLKHLTLSFAEAEQLLKDSGPGGRLLLQLLESWTLEQKELCRLTTGDGARWPIWDEVTTSYLLGMTEFDDYPRPTMREDMTFVHDEGTHLGIRWITAVDQAALWADLAASLRPEAESAPP